MKNKIKEKYLEKPWRCPYCGSEDIEGKALETHGDATATQDVWCNTPNCGEQWTDVYTLTDVN